MTSRPGRPGLLARSRACGAPPRRRTRPRPGRPGLRRRRRCRTPRRQARCRARAARRPGEASAARPPCRRRCGSRAQSSSGQSVPPSPSARSGAPAEPFERDLVPFEEAPELSAGRFPALSDHDGPRRRRRGRETLTARPIRRSGSPASLPTSSRRPVRRPRQRGSPGARAASRAMPLQRGTRPGTRCRA